MTRGAPTLRTTLIEGIKASAGLAIAVGVLLVMTGVLAIAAPFVAGLSVMLMIGGLLIAGGVALAVFAFRLGAFGAGVMVVLMGALMVLAGVYIFSEPVAALESMTLFLAIYFFVTGLTEIFTAFTVRPAEGWGWMATTGLVSFVLGVMLWRHFPLSGIWAVGTLFGVKLLTSGSWLIALGSAVRRGTARAQAAG